MDEAAKRQFRNLDYLYARNIWTRTATQEEAAFLNEYLSDPNVTNENLAYNFDSDLARNMATRFSTKATYVAPRSMPRPGLSVTLTIRTYWKHF